MLPTASPGRKVTFRYHFRLSDGEEKSFLVELDFDTLAILTAPRTAYPEWTALSHHKCPNCPLNEAEHPRCPVAANIVDVVEFFRDSISHEEAEVTVEADGRRYVKETSLQQAISSLIGIYMVTSGCPILNKLRPMVDTHLPFMSSSESVYRTLSMYLLAQYFRMKNGDTPDWNLDGVVTFLREARTTNHAFCRRLQSLGIKDASLNAMNSLNAMGEITRLSLESGDLTRWEAIFLEHFGERPVP